MELNIAAAKYYLGIFTPRDLPRLAVQALAANIDSPSLRQLAGADETESSEELGKLLEKSLRELKIPIPSQDDAGLQVAQSIAKDVLDGTLTPYDGAKIIWNEIYIQNSKLKILLPFVGLAGEYEDDRENRTFYENELIREFRALKSEREIGDRHL